MAKRISLKGKGADIFFGNYDPAAAKRADGDSLEMANRTPKNEPDEIAVDLPRTPAKHASTRARTHASMPARTPTPPMTILLDELRQRLRVKQHLASSTFRFRSEELERLDRAFAAIGTAHHDASKNDLVRLGLNWLLSDYEENGDESMLVRVLARV